MAQVLDLPEAANYGAEKFIQLYVDKCSESPVKLPQEVETPKEDLNIQPEAEVKLKTTRFELFGQNYKMRFSQKSNIYQCLDQRLRNRGKRSSNGAPGALP